MLRRRHLRKRPAGTSAALARCGAMRDSEDGGSAERNGVEMSDAAGAERVVIKKYANRRLYNTASSSYVTLEHLADMVKQGVDFVVFDAKTGEDITRSVLTQIIFEEESKGQTLLPIPFLRQLIGFYGDSMQAFLPSYLELSLQSFAKQQEALGKQFGAQFGTMAGGAKGLPAFDEQIRQNMALFDRAMKMFSPFAYAEGAKPSAAPDAAKPADAPAADAGLDALKAQLDAMQKQIEKLAAKSS
jgi:polyhydroxyalkanoate synthesis repressor PhaR